MTTEQRTTLDRATAEDLLFEEARRIDEGRLEAWLELFTPDAIYWVPSAVEDPSFEPSLIYDTRARMEERVYRLTKTPAHAQNPASWTVRTVTNVQVLPDQGVDGSTVVRCNLVIHELRPGDPGQVGLGAPRSFAGACEYSLSEQPDGRWLIRQKKVHLLSRELPLYNLTFVI
ncbi:MAG TPA: aromatic-ring-hydroxylating dioxygenase subunit beta [Coriobacteriia bacterium]|nr:aromatic-ring-hydroxylating dioxygenase subunit beta [Coriobacteriia bacterium]